MRVLIGSSGSYGDLYPFIAIGRELVSRGHDVRLFASAAFASTIRKAGLEPVPIGTAEDYQAVVRHPQAFHPKHGFRVIADATLAMLPESCRLLEEAIVPGETLLVGSTLALGTRLVAEKHRLPAATVHLSPVVFRSVHESPQVGDARLPPWLPAPLKRLAYRIIDRLVVDPRVAPELNRVREAMGLGPVQRVFDRWIHDADCLIGLFPDWFAARQDDWPAHTHLTGFPLYDAAAETELPRELEEFLDAGEPPVVFTAGTAAFHEQAFFQTSIAVCERAGLRGILLTRYRDQVPEPLPDEVRHFEYVPFSKVLPRTAAIVHHGGIGTTSQGLAAGTPQLIRPLAFDQQDNARRLEALGAGGILPPSRYEAESAAREIVALTSSSSTRAACRHWAERLAEDDAVARTCDRLVACASSASSRPR